MEVSVHQAKTQLSQLLNLVEDGEEVVIRRHGKVIARLVAANTTRQSPLGAMRGEFELKDGWERPLTDKEADAFLKGKW
jgi:prevent-host-death family protein